jgi:hypothetical protein
LATAYAPLAAQAYLKAEIDSPVTVIRLLGAEGDDASDDGQPGWDAEHAFGIFVAPTSSVGAVDVEASLVGIVYTTQDGFQVGVKGREATRDDTIVSRATGSANFGDVRAVEIDNHLFTVSMASSGGSTVLEKTVSFRDGIKYIRDELNTNPTTTNDDISSPTDASLAGLYWLGETFEEEYERVVRENTRENSSAAKLMVWVMRLATNMDDFKSSNHGLTAAKSGWVIPQYNGERDVYDPTKLERLFRMVALDEGEQGTDLNIRIENIKIALPGEPSPFGRFDVVVEQKRGGRVYTVETFESLNLNPNSDNFIARRIGDQYFEWSAAEKRNKVYGSYPNQSSYVRVEMEPDVGENGPTNQRSVPFGFLGPIVPTGSSPSVTNGTGSYNIDWIGNGTFFSPDSNTQVVRWPQVPHVISSSVRPDLAAKYALGGTQYNKTTATAGTVNFSSVNKGMRDFLRRGSSWDSGRIYSAQDTGIATAGAKHSYIFSLDEVFVTGNVKLSNDMADFAPTKVAFISGSHRRSADRAFTSHEEGGTQLSASALLELVDGFSMPLAGGFDGVNIVEADPFNMRASVTARPTAGPDATTRNSYAYASVDRAIELIKDPEALEMNLAVMPGITNPDLTRKLVQTCEARADALAIIDLPDVYVPPQQSRCTSFRDRVDGTTPAKSAKALKARQLNSSYGAAYYPWVKVRDTINSRDVWAPPSVVALGVMGYTEQRDEVWFAPAGFNRGGLNEGNAGLPVLQASEQLLSSQRDTLYEANINPIASFVSEGLVVFGQKTLQMTPSALDRINVRRLLIFVKKEVSRIASGLLFDQNVPATWNRFTGQVVPFLESVKTRLGLTDFKVVLDNTTTTPDLVDRNIMYAKIFLKPARAIEFIAVDFVITRSGASFDD